LNHHEVPEPAGETRTETDTFGPIKVSVNSYYGAQTARSMYHFNIGIPTGKIKYTKKKHFLYIAMFRSNAASIN
jgi:fumarate hydratase class II